MSWYNGLFLVEQPGTGQDCGRWLVEGWTSPRHPAFGIYARQGRYVVVHLPSLKPLPLAAMAGFFADGMPTLADAQQLVERIAPLASWADLGEAHLPALLDLAVRMIALDVATPAAPSKEDAA